MHKRAGAIAAAVGAVSLAAGWPAVVCAQNLFRAPLPPAAPESTKPAKDHTAPGGAEGPGPQPPSGPGVVTAPPANAGGGGGLSLEQVSLLVVVPPKPKTYQKHDKVEIIVNETFATKFEGKLDTKKEYDLSAELSQFPSLTALLAEIELRNGVGGTTPKAGINSATDFKSSGTYEKKDNLTARISALVLEVKPNGHLVLEAQESIQSNEETKTMVLSGIVDPKDITRSGTVQSAQMANLSIRVRHEGQVNDSSQKGMIPRFFEAVFNF